MTASDLDGDTVTFVGLGGTDSASFTLDSSTGALAFTTAPDYETDAAAIPLQ